MRVTVLAASLALSIAPFANAAITSWNCGDDGDGAIVMGQGVLTDITPALSPPEYRLDITGQQHMYPAHTQGAFVTDTPLDPTVWIVETVENYTNFTWTDYHIAIGLDRQFSIVGVVAPPDWTWSITPPADGRQEPNQPPGTLGWVGYLDYFAGTPVPPAQPGQVPAPSGQFGLVVSFTGSVQFCTEQIPTAEPTTALLLGLGALLLRRRSRR
jgi:hypothetical protein